MEAGRSLLVTRQALDALAERLATAEGAATAAAAVEVR